MVERKTGYLQMGKLVRHCAADASARTIELIARRPEHFRTITADNGTDLRKWMLAIWLLASMKKPPSAAELARQLGVTSKTAWLMRRKTLVAVSVEQTPGGGVGRAHLRVVEDASAKTLTAAARQAIQPGSTIKTDGWRSHRALSGAGYVHERHDQPTPRSASELLPWSHIVISNFKRWQLDVFHGVSAAHLQSYLEEFCYRLNRRGDRHDLCRRILNRCVLYMPPITYSELIAARVEGMVSHL